MGGVEQAHSTRPVMKNTGNFIGLSSETVAEITLQRTDTTHDLSSESREAITLNPTVYNHYKQALPTCTYSICIFSSLPPHQQCQQARSPGSRCTLYHHPLLTQQNNAITYFLRLLVMLTLPLDNQRHHTYYSLPTYSFMSP